MIDCFTPKGWSAPRMNKVPQLFSIVLTFRITSSPMSLYTIYMTMNPIKKQLTHTINYLHDTYTKFSNSLLKLLKPESK